MLAFAFCNFDFFYELAMLGIQLFGTISEFFEQFFGFSFAGTQCFNLSIGI